MVDSTTKGPASVAVDPILCIRELVHTSRLTATLRSGQTFDVVLTDIEMPDMNGFEFAESIRADQNLSQTPIIGLSSLV